ncbi:HET-domain-containing protein, partial [Westerdykella ornata]
EFRLLILRPGSQSDDLVINLATENFASTNQYVAISYCWGSSEKPKDLQCISQTSIRNPGSEGIFSTGRLPITTNLDRMLRTLRSEEGFLVAWIDAICINQDDVTEKAQQIQMMHRIYSKAAVTILYAGEDDEETVPAFQCIKCVSPRGQESSVSLVKAFSNLLSRDWFQRVWVMQEVVLSPRKR